MVKKTEKGKRSEAGTGPGSVSHSGATRTLECIGDICFNEVTGKIEISVKRDSCDIDVIKGLVENIVEGREVEFKIPQDGESE